MPGKVFRFGVPDFRLAEPIGVLKEVLASDEAAVKYSLVLPLKLFGVELDIGLVTSSLSDSILSSLVVKVSNSRVVQSALFCGISEVARLTSIRDIINMSVP